MHKQHMNIMQCKARSTFLINSNKHLPAIEIGSKVSYFIFLAKSNKVWISRIIPRSFTSLFPSSTTSPSSTSGRHRCIITTTTQHQIDRHSSPNSTSIEWRQNQQQQQQQQTKMCSTEYSTEIPPTSASASRSRSSDIMDIEDLHKHAVMAKENTYIDPSTGFMVFTEYAHLKRGKCCGNACRHCPYGWEGVKQRNAKTGGMIRKIPKVRSGNRDGIQQLLQKIDHGEYFHQESRRSLSHDDDSDSDSDDDVSAVTETKTETLDCGGGCNKNTSEVKRESKIQQTNSKSGGRYGGTKTDKNVPYTRTGDAGTSVLLTGERRSKDDIAFEAMGTVDELCSVVGTVHAELSSTSSSRLGQQGYGDLEEWLLDVMSRLFDIGSHVAKPCRVTYDDEDDEDGDVGVHIFNADGIGNGFDVENVHILEELIDIMTDKLPELTSFILPTGSRAAAQLHVARCVCRRAERRVLPLVRDGVCDPNAAKYLNRLSDFFFTAARYVNFCDGQKEFQYRRFTRAARQRNRVTVDLREEKKVP